jgi:hypothetical protein
VIRFDGIIGVLLRDVAGGRKKFIEHAGIGRCPVRTYFGRMWTVLQGTGEEPAGGRQISFLGYQHVDDLPDLVDRPVQIDPPPNDLHIRLIDEPPIARGVPTEPCHVDQQRGEPLHPPINL